MINKALRIVFMGSPDFAVPSLRILVEEGYQIVGVVTATDKLGGRGGNQLIESEVKKYALSVGLHILQPKNLKSKIFLGQLRTLNADVILVVAFRMLPEAVWNLPPLGTYNLHGSLLPKYRGAAPINWAIINGENITGLTVFKLQHEIDTGLILMQKSAEIGPDEDFGSVYDRLKEIGSQLLLDCVKKIAIGDLEYKTQDDSKASYAPKLFYETCRIDFNKTPLEIHNFVRGLSPHPTAHFQFNGDEMKVYRIKIENTNHDYEIGSIHSDRKKILKIAVTGGFIHLIDIKLEGKRRMNIIDFLNGYHWPEVK